MLEIRLLGELELLRGGRPLKLPASKKSRALLGYLVATDRPHLREALCDLLWQGPDDPRAALRWSLTKIRSLVDEGRVTRIIADRERVAFESKGASIDLLQARAFGGDALRTASTDDLRRAVGNFRSEFLAGLDLPDCYRYHEWLVGEREAARALRVSLLVTLVDRLEDTPEEALSYARTRVTIDPLAEAAHVAVIRILTKLGRKREAVAQFDTCRHILQSELGAKPSPALLQARTTLPETVETPQIALPMQTRLPPSLVGRVGERREISARVKSAIGGVAQPILLFVGEAGIGKTRLLDAVASEMRAAGGTVLGGRAFEAEMVRPYAVWVEAFGEAIFREREDLTDRTRLFDAVARTLAGIAEKAPVALLLDDVQWLDDASAALLHFLVRGLGPKVLVVLAARPGELGDNAPVQRLVRALLREERLVQREVTALAEDDIVELTRAIAPAVDAHRVYAESAGHPYFALEIARALADGDESVPASLSAMIEDRLARLEPRAQGLVPWIAALQRGFELDLLTRVTGLAPAEILSSVGELERHGIVVSLPTDGYDFAHDLLRAGAYRQLSEPRRKLIHLQIARTLAAALPTGGVVAGHIAHHAALGGDHALTAQMSLLTGRAFLKIFANEEAAAVARIGTHHVGFLPREARLALHVDLLRVIVQSATWTSRAPEFEAELLRVAHECETAGLSAAAAIGLFELSVVQHDRGNFGSAQATSFRAVAAGRKADPITRADTLSAGARCLVIIERDMPRAGEMLAEAGGLVRETGVELLEFNWGSGLFRIYAGDEAHGRTLLERALGLAQEKEEHWAHFRCLMDLAMVDLDRGNAREALPRLVELGAVASKMSGGSEGAQASALAAVARVILLEEGAEALLESAASTLRALDAKGLLAYVLTLAARVDLEHGELEKAHEKASEAMGAALALNRRTHLALARSVLIRVALAKSDRPEAARLFDAILPDLEEHLGLSARARDEACSLGRILGRTIPTATPTATSTPGI